MKINKKPNSYCGYRKSTGLTQGEFAKLVGCAPSTVQAVELGKLVPSKKLWFSFMRVSIDFGVEKIRNELMKHARKLTE